MSASLLRVAARGPSSFLRANLVVARAQPIAARAGLAVASLPTSSFSTSARLRSEHQEETFEEFSAR
jgi:cytochrome c oxidase subunit 5a